MRKIILLATLFILSVTSFAQDKSVQDMQNQSNRGGKDDTSKKAKGPWKVGGTFSLNIGQGGSRNWAAGAEKYSISLASYLSLYANRTYGKWKWENTLDLGYAYINQHSNGSRKNDDKIDLFSKIGRSIGKNLSAALVGNFRSQFTDGFDYNYLGQGLKRRTSDFFAPAYITLAPGLDWKPTDYFSIFISPVSARWVVVSNEPKSYYFPGGVIPDPMGGGFEMPMSTYYGVDPEREVRFELGGFASVQFNKEIFKNVTYKSRLDLYSNYLKSYRFAATGPDELLVTEIGPKPQNVDVYWTNTFTLKVNKWLAATYNLDLIYDDDVRQFGPNKTSAATQIRSLLAVGVAAKF